MKNFYPCLPLILAIALATLGQGQPPRVHTEYMRAEDMTQVATNVLYVVNTPEQFMQLQFSGWYQGRQPVSPVALLKLGLYSFATAANYQTESQRRLVVVADGMAHDWGLLDYNVLQVGKGINIEPPRSAQVRGKVLLESMTIAIKPEQLAKIVGPRDVEMQLGRTRFALNEEHLSIIRDFAAYTISPGGAAKLAALANSGEQSAALPPELKGAPLNTTLKWLSKQIDKHGTTTRQGGRFEQLMPIDFTSCQIKYRTVQLPERLPTFRLPPTYTEYRVDLADLNPDTVRTYDADGNSFISFTTHNHEFKIKSYLSGTGNGIGMQSGSFKLDQTTSAPAIAAALMQTVRLCQAKP